jgi:predicted RNA-binding Zn-ribbon protein involved in translation (DUF1610 family)
MAHYRLRRGTRDGVRHIFSRKKNQITSNQESKETMNGEGHDTTKCPKCGKTEIAKGRLSLSSGHYLSGMVFEPERRRFFTLNVMPGPYLAPESYACLSCGAVWSQTDPSALREFIGKHCKKSD